MARRSTRRRTKPATPTLAEAAAGQRIWVLTLPWGVRHPQVKWYPTPGVNVFAGAALPTELAPYMSLPYTLARKIEDAHNGFPGTPAVAAPKTPRTEQIEAARAIVKSCMHWPLTHLGSDVGQGKTISAILAAKALLKVRNGNSVLVVVDRPSTITSSSWRESIAGVGDGGYDWLIVSPDQLKKLVINRKPLYDFDVCLIDETQNFRHVSQQTAALRRVAKYSSPKPPAIVTITNTLGHNPSEYLSLTPLLAAIHGDPASQWIDLGAKLIANGFPLEPSRFNKGEYTWSQAARDTPALQQQATDTVRRWMTDATPPALIYQPARWGPAPVQAIPVDLSPEQADEYQAAWMEFRRANQIAKSGSDSDAGRAALLRLRQKASFIRAAHTVNLAVSQVKKGRQPVIAVELLSTAGTPIADALEAAGIPCARLFGTNDAAAERIAFQRGHKPAAVINKTSAISLHANEHMGDGSRASSAVRVGFFHQPRFSGIHARQTIGRTHRDGQTSPWFFLYARNTVEEDAAAVMVNRLQNAAASTSGDVSAWQQIAAGFGVQWIQDGVDPM